MSTKKEAPPPIVEVFSTPSEDAETGDDEESTRDATALASRDGGRRCTGTRGRWPLSRALNGENVQ
ncbi:hypothetical protein NITHO_2270004 [Nitrolancea hollandica Lb]|uniref:Uncharacterized protein n=1 Tax=Nitrolancea hollandica Lb TaxID=1129897 RepID=I4EFC5_9BACT|nr:hypothetical protein NITHO_2270004 [Nitrolancea hollandica Lb]